MQPKNHHKQIIGLYIHSLYNIPLKSLRPWKKNLLNHYGQTLHMGVSKNMGKPPKSSISIGFSIINHPFWGTPIFGNTPHVDKLNLRGGETVIPKSCCRWPRWRKKFRKTNGWISKERPMIKHWALCRHRAKKTSRSPPCYVFSFSCRTVGSKKILKWLYRMYSGYNLRSIAHLLITFH